MGLPHASPSVRKFARELGVPLAEVKGSGLKGRITEADVQAFTKAVMAGSVQTQAIAAVGKAAPSGGGAGAELGLIPWPKVDFAKFGPIERKEMSRIKKISGANLLRNAIMIPAVTNHDDADITELETFRVSTNKENEKSGIKVTMLAFLIKACVAALKKFPEFNSSLDGDAIVYKNYWHIGFAADTPNGLMVPVIKDADKKGIFQISQEMGELAKKARDGKLSPAEMSGATFTISSLGGIGGRYFTPIINAPEVAILGVCRSTMEPVWDGKAFQPRLMLPLSLTWDHRVIDGAAAARDESRHRGIGQAHQRIDIERDHVAHLVDVGCEQRRGGADAGIVHQHIHRTRAHQRVADFQRLLAGVRLRDQQLVDVDAELAGIDRIERVFSVDEGADAALLLAFRHSVQRQRGLARRFRPVDLDDAALRQATDAERDIEPERSRRHRLDVHRTVVLAELHHRALAELALDLGERG